MNWMLKNSNGQKDSMFTLAIVGCIVTILSVLAGIFSGTEIFLNQDNKIVLQSPDATIVVAFLGSSVLAYVNRRNTKDNHEHELEKLKIEKGIIQ